MTWAKTFPFAVLLVAVLLSRTAGAEEAASAPPDNAVMIGLTPLSWAWHIGSHRDLSDAKIDQAYVASLGAVVAYQRHISPYFRVGPRLEYIRPLPDRFLRLNELRVLAAASAVLPVLDSRLELSAGIETGLGLFLGHLEEPISADDKLQVAPGFSVGLLVGARGWLSDVVALHFDVGPSLSFAPQNDDGFGLDQIRLLRSSVGVAFGW